MSKDDKTVPWPRVGIGGYSVAEAQYPTPGRARDGRVGARERFALPIVMLASAVWLLAACTDSPIQVGSRNPLLPSLQVAQAASDTVDMLVVSRFSLDVSASGELRPNTPIVLHATVRGTLSTEDVELRMTLPEVEISEANGWRPNALAPISKELPSRHRERRRIGMFERAELTETVVIPQPGYYRVSVSAVQRSNEPVVEKGRWVQNANYREVWLLVDEHGGRVTNTFDPTVFADTVSPEPGPRRYHPRWTHLAASAVPPSGSLARPQSALPSPSVVPLIGGGSPQVEQIVFYDNEAAATVAVAGATVTIKSYNSAGTLFSTVKRVTDSNGYYTGVCNTNPSNSYILHFVELTNTDINITNGGGTFGGGACAGGPIQHTIASEVSWIWTRLNQFIPFSRGVLNAIRARVDVKYDATVSGSFYYSVNDRISYSPSAVYFDYGRFTIAHEYGHAIHEKALAGNAARGSLSANMSETPIHPEFTVRG